MQARSQRLLQQQRLASVPPNKVGARARVVTEGAIASALLARIAATGRGDRVEIAALYLSQRELVQALLDAARRGVVVRLLLDPGKDGYGYVRSGIPNREAASELVAASDGAVRVRWYRTHGEQFSPGFVLVQSGASGWLMIGTAELTRRDLGDFDLAAAIIVDLPPDAAAAAEAHSIGSTCCGSTVPPAAPSTPPTPMSIPMPRNCATGNTACSRRRALPLTDAGRSPLSTASRCMDNRDRRQGPPVAARLRV